MIRNSYATFHDLWLSDDDDDDDDDSDSDMYSYEEYSEIIPKIIFNCIFWTQVGETRIISEMWV